MLSKEELLKPRYKVIADYPLSEYEVGFIIQGVGFTKPWKDNFKTFFYEDYPYLFKKLEWWENREIEDLPEYLLKISDDDDAVEKGEIITIKDFKWWGFHTDNKTWKLFFPATREEFEQYQKSK